MYRIRVVPTKSRSKAVQVVKRGGHKIEVVKHIGSARLTGEVEKLRKLAWNWIKRNNNQLALFEVQNPVELVSLDKMVLHSTVPRLIHLLYMQTIRLFGFDQLLPQVLLDLVFMRLVEPASKLASIQILAHEFGIKHSIATVNRKLTWLTGHKTAIEQKAAVYARKFLGFDFTLVFYDVTTMYFETFKADEQGGGLRRPGFSKDNKHQQPQIVLGLVVTKEGFPVEFKTFAGNKFEGHTLIPTLVQFRQRHQTDNLTVVADAAMLSHDNIGRLKQEGVGYIVGARLANLSASLIEKIATQLPHINQASIRIPVKGRGFLICQFSRKRYAKDKHETKKQVSKALRALKTPGKAIKRLKFIAQSKSKGKDLRFNSNLLEKAKKLWGVKGYYTDQKQLTNKQIIGYYHNLWQVEKAFRMSKTDIKARPIYHHKTQNIIAHLLICFMALCVAKHWEKQTNLSTKKLVQILKNIRDADFEDQSNGKRHIIKKKLTDQEKAIVEKLG